MSHPDLKVKSSLSTPLKNRVIAPLILRKHYMEVSGQLHTPVALLPGKKPPVPFEKNVGWIPEPVWKFWRREDLFPLSET
jgi:hypothetical protein